MCNLLKYWQWTDTNQGREKWTWCRSDSSCTFSQAGFASLLSLVAGRRKLQEHRLNTFVKHPLRYPNQGKNWYLFLQLGWGPLLPPPSDNTARLDKRFHFMEQSQHKFYLFRFFPGFLVDKAFNEIYLVLLFWQTKTCIQKNLGQPFLKFILFLPLHDDMIEYTNMRKLEVCGPSVLLVAWVQFYIPW